MHVNSLNLSARGILSFLFSNFPKEFRFVFILCFHLLLEQLFEDKPSLSRICTLSVIGLSIQLPREVISEWNLLINEIIPFVNLLGWYEVKMITLKLIQLQLQHQLRLY
jgi:hypothetical protein